ncbi:MAG: serine/threonine-protein kinase [Pirellulales bacterium]
MSTDQTGDFTPRQPGPGRESPPAPPAPTLPLQRPDTSLAQPPQTLLHRSDESPAAAASEAGAASGLESLTVPGYELLRPLGRGGMGVVYLARQTALKRLVALKMILSGDRENADELARFRAEAEAAARVRHPNLVQVYEIGDAQGRPYIALEYVPGGSLAQRLTEGPYAPRDAAQLVARVADAAQCAHAAGVVHRDLKPANILLDADGSPRIADFGLAKRLDDRSGLTQSGTILGTPSYMAPEQAEAQADQVGPAADLYSLGAILYELLVGRPPFRGATVLDTLRQVREQEPVAPGRLQPGVPRDLETICLKCLEKNWRRRYASAGELADDLRRFLDSRPIAARPVGRLERAGKWARREPWLAGVSAGLVLVVVVALATVSWQLWRELQVSEKLSIALQERSTALERQIAATNELEAALKREAKATEDARRETKLKEIELERAGRLLYLHTVTGATREWQLGDVGKAEQWLNSSEAGRRDWEWRYLRRQTLATQFVYAAHTLGQVVEFQGDGRRLMLRRDVLGTKPAATDQVHWWDRERGRPVAQSPATTAAFAPSNQVGAVARWFDSPPRSEVQIVSLESGDVVLGCEGRLGQIVALEFTPDSERLAAIDMEGTIQVWDAATGKSWKRHVDASRKLPPLQMLSLYRPAVISRDGRWAALACGQIVNVEDGALKTRVPPFSAAGFSPDGRRLALLPKTGALNRHVVQLFETESGAKLHELKLLKQDVNHFVPVSELKFSPDGTRFAASTGRGGIVLQFLGEAIVWDAASGEELLRIAPGSTSVTSLDFSSDGMLLALGGDSGVVQLYDAKSGRLQRTFRTPQRRAIVDLTFSPDVAALAAAHCTLGGTMPQNDAQVTLWSVERVPEALTLEMPPASAHDASTGYFPLVRSVRLRFSDDGRTVTWNGMAENGLERRSVAAQLPEQLSAAASSIAITPAAADDAEALASRGSFAVVERGRDGRTQAQTPGRLIVLPQSGAPEQELLKEGEWNVWNGAVTRDGRTLIAMLGTALSWQSEPPFGMAVKVWSAADGRVLFSDSKPDRRPGTAAISPDGRRIAYVHHPRRGKSRLEVWDLTTRQLLHELAAENSVQLLALSPDGRRLAAGDFRGPITVWNLNDPAPKPVAASGHSGRVHALSFHPAGDRLASIGEDLVVRLWDTATGQLVLELPGTGELLQNVAFSPDGRRLAANDRLGRLRVWDGTELAEPTFASWPPSVAELDRRIAAGEDNVEVWRLRALAAVRSSDWATAAESQWKAAQRDVARDGHWRQAIEFAKRAARFDLVRQYCSQLLERDSSRAELWIERGEAALRLGDYAAAVDDLGEGERRVGNNLEFKCTYGGALLLAGKPEEYQRFVEQTKLQAESSGWIDEQHGNVVRNRYLLARLAGFAKQPPVAVDVMVGWAEGAVARAKNAWNYHALAVALFRAERFEEATAAAQASIARDPGWVPEANELLLALIARRPAPASHETDDAPLHIHDHIGLQLLVEQASSLLPPPPPASRREPSSLLPPH